MLNLPYLLESHPDFGVEADGHTVERAVQATAPYPLTMLVQIFVHVLVGLALLGREQYWLALDRMAVLFFLAMSSQ